MDARDLLRAYLRDNKIKQREFAKRIDVSEQWLSMVFTGKRRMTSLSIALRIDKATDGAVSVQAWEES